MSVLVLLSPSLRAATLSVCALSLTAALLAQVPAAGYQSQLQSVPGSANSLAVVDENVVWFDGVTLFVDSPSQPSRALLTLPGFRFGSFTLPIGNGNLLFAESSNGQLWRVPLDPLGTPSLLTTVQFAYDAVAIGTRMAVVSAKPGGFASAQNDLIAVDLVTGAQSTIGVIPGASGPLALNAAGELLYATASLNFPPPPASVEILSWTAGQWSLALNGGLVLTRANAHLVLSGIDSAGDLAVDGDDDLIAADWANSRLLEINDHRTTPTVSTLIDYGTAAVSPATLAFRQGTVPGTEFEPFGRTGAGELLVVETNFFSITQVRCLTTAPSTLDLVGTSQPVAAGPFTLLLQNGPPAGLSLFAIGTVGTGVMLPLHLPGFEQTLPWEAGLLYPLLTSLVPLDAAGSGPLGLTNPGFPGGLWIHTQTMFVTADGSQLGTSNVSSVQLQ